VGEKINKTTKILLGSLTVAVIIFMGFYLLGEKEIYELSKEMVKEGEHYYQKKEYKKARLFFERALKRYNDLIVLKLLKTGEIKQLEKRLETDPALQKVAQGYIYYGGRWVNEKELEALMKEKRRLKQKINIYLKTAKFFGSIEDIENNIRIYQKALEELEESPFRNEDDIKQLKKQLQEKLALLSEEAIKKYKQTGNLEKLVYYYEILLTYTPSPEIKKELFQTYLQLSEKYTNKGKYLQALVTLLKAKKLNVDTASVLPKIEHVILQIEPEDLKGKNIEDAYLFYALAKKSYSRFDIKEAQRLLEKSLSLEPENTAVRIFYAKVLLDLGKIKEAKEITEKILKKEPDNVDAQILAGDIFFKSGDTKKAVSFYEKARDKAQIKDKLFKAYKKLGLLFFNNKDFQKAEKYLIKAISIKDDPIVYKTLGDIYLARKELSRAEKNYTKAIKIDPSLKKELRKNIGNIHLSRGKEYLNQKKYKSAIKEFKKALRYLGNRQDVLQNLAESYEKIGDTKTSLAYYKKLNSSKAKTKEAKLYIQLGEEAYQKGDYFTALKHFNRAKSLNKDIDLKDKITPLYIKIGDKYFNEGNFDKAISYYQKAINNDKSVYEKIKDKLFKAYKNYGIKLYKQKQYISALKYLKEAEKIKSEDIDIIYYLGNLYLKTGDLKKSLKYFEKYLSYKPSDAEILKKMAIIYLESGNIVQAKKYAEKLLALNKSKDVANFIIGAYYYTYEKNPQKALSYLLKAENYGYKKGNLYYYIGRIYYDQGNYLRAITYLTEALSKGYKNEKVYYYRALSYLKLKDYRKAINDLSMVIKHNPNNGEAYFLRGKLYYEHGNYVKGEYKKAIEDLERAAAMGIKEAEKLLTEARTKK